MTLQAIDVSKRFNDFVALDRVSLTVERGELVALLGPSGSGKTTLLRIIAGLEQASEGQVLFGGEDVGRRHLRYRRVGFCFQHYALFKHMTVFENVAFGLTVKPRGERPPKSEIKARVLRLLDLVQLAPFVDRYPAQLSGGQRQRVALARALAIEPAVLLLDEPFGALDAKVRKELRRWLRNLHDEMQLTSVFVTHDQEEALELADRVVLMNHGRIEQMGSPHDVYEHPATAFAYEFLGHVNRLACRVDDGKALFPGGAVELPADAGNGAPVGGHAGLGLADHPPAPIGNGGTAPAATVAAAPDQAAPDQAASPAAAIDPAAIAYVRPHDVEIFSSPVMVGTGAVVRFVSAAGPFVKVELAVDDDDTLIECDLSREEVRKLDLKVGQAVYIRARKARVFTANGDHRMV
jgi:sulfate transport system ATP-binding protein